VIQRFFTWDAHNLDRRGENTLLVANYTMGIRLIDTTDKTKPVETSFYLPNANLLPCVAAYGALGTVSPCGRRFESF
jgi:hypothetical protein